MRRLIKRAEVQRRTSKSKSAIYDGIKKGTFPKPVPTGTHGVAWVESEIDAHVEKCIAARDSREAR